MDRNEIAGLDHIYEDLRNRAKMSLKFVCPASKPGPKRQQAAALQKSEQAQNTRPRAAPPVPVDPRQATLAVGQGDLSRAALEHAGIPGREPFNLIQDLQGGFHFVQSVKLTSHRPPGLVEGRAPGNSPKSKSSACTFPAMPQIARPVFSSDGGAGSRGEGCRRRKRRSGTGLGDGSSIQTAPLALSAF